MVGFDGISQFVQDLSKGYLDVYVPPRQRLKGGHEIFDEPGADLRGPMVGHACDPGTGPTLRLQERLMWRPKKYMPGHP